ncbi:hypothetical protein [Stieleria maiorica]|nr:hypothetical protein [Stieleria maiorica]
MNLWSAKRWGARVRKRGEETWVDLKQPYALVGSDPRCDIQIGDSKLPPVVYFVVACGDRIEVWPTCPLAYPIWGRVSKNHVLMVGRSRIQFFFKDERDIDLGQEADLDDDSADVTQDSVLSLALQGGSVSEGQDAANPVEQSLPSATLILDWGRGPRYKSLNRNVSIIGEDHPSLIRLHNADLERCDQGIVCFGESVWLVELHPSRLSPNQPTIRRVCPGDESVLVGGIHLWVEGTNSLDLDKLKKSATSAGDSPATASVGATSPRGDAMNGGLIRRHDHAADVPRPQRRLTVGESQSEDDPECLTVTLTDRVLEAGVRKSLRRRVLKTAAIATLLILAVLLVVAILFMGMLPTIRAIYGY